MCAYNETCIITDLAIVSSRDPELADELFFKKKKRKEKKERKKERNGPSVAERQILYVQEQLWTDLIDERKDVYRRDGFRDQGNEDKSQLTPWQRCLGLSLEKRCLLIGTSVQARHGRNLRQPRGRARPRTFRFILDQWKFTCNTQTHVPEPATDIFRHYRYAGVPIIISESRSLLHLEPGGPSRLAMVRTREMRWGGVRRSGTVVAMYYVCM